MRAPTLRGQLTWAALLTTLVALVLSAGSLLAYEWSTYRGVWVEDLRTQADLIAHSSAAALIFNDRKSAQENLALLGQKPRIRAALILDASGRTFASYMADDRAASWPPGGPRLTSAVAYRFDGPTLQLAYPVLHDNERVGAVLLLARHDVWRRLRTYAAIEAGVMAAALALALLVFGRLQRRVTQPLASMARVAHEVMQRRDWHLRAPSTSNADIASLVDAFNGMLDEVEARTGQLEREMAERQRAEEGLRAADRRKDEFLATLAHELRNPLAPMTNSMALLRMPGAGQGVRDKALGILERQLRQMARLIDDLLDVSRITTGKLLLRNENVDLRALLRAAVETMEPQAAERRLTLAAHLGPEPCAVVGDPARLSQVFSNLLNNACRYTPPGGRIDVEMHVGADAVEVAVRDTGIGVDPAMQERVFDLFEQADKSLERGNAGLGIGLTLARQLVQLHGGSIALHSDGLGRGACFTVRLPRPHSPVRAVAGDEVPRAAGSAAALRVLLADDNVDFVQSLEVFLQAKGHSVQAVHNGDAALKAALAAPPDVVVLDIGMPGLNGYEVARRLRADPATAALTLVAVTGWGQAADREASAAAGFDHHLVKPVAPDDLLAMLMTQKRQAQ